MDWYWWVLYKSSIVAIELMKRHWAVLDRYVNKVRDLAAMHQYEAMWWCLFANKIPKNWRARHVCFLQLYAQRSWVKESSNSGLYLLLATTRINHRKNKDRKLVQSLTHFDKGARAGKMFRSYFVDPLWCWRGCQMTLKHTGLRAKMAEEDESFLYLASARGPSSRSAIIVMKASSSDLEHSSNILLRV